MKTEKRALKHAQAATTVLRAWQNADGGWPYRRGGESFLEPTAWATVALAEAFDERAPLAPALAFIGACRSTDGSWGIRPGDRGGTWMVALAALAFCRAGRRTEARRACSDLLAFEDGFRGLPSPKERALFERIFGLQMGLRGWPWYPGTASWVEPTACSLWALAENGHLPRTPRLAAGQAYLEDRAIPEGGWNYGNPRVFDARLDPFPVPTALAAIALGRMGMPLTDTPLERSVHCLLDLAPELFSEQSRAIVARALLEVSRASGAPTNCTEVAEGLWLSLPDQASAWPDEAGTIAAAWALSTYEETLELER